MKVRIYIIIYSMWILAAVALFSVIIYTIATGSIVLIVKILSVFTLGVMFGLAIYYVADSMLDNIRILRSQKK